MCAQEAEALQVSEERFRAVWEVASDAMALSDPDGIVLAVNPAYEALYGLRADEAVGHSFALIFPEQARAAAEQAYREVFASSEAPAPFETSARHADGTERFVDARATFVVHGGQRVAMLSVIRDITDRKRSETERAALLEQSERMAGALAAERDRLRQVLDLLPEAVLIADRDGAVLLGNRVSEQVLGVDLTGQSVPVGPDPAFGSRSVDGRSVAADDLPLARALFRREVVTGAQLLLHRPDGHGDLPVLVNSAPLLDSAGAIFGAVAVFQDISAIKDLERQKDEFLATVSHDLQQPLAIVRGRAQLLRRSLMRGQSVAPERITDSLAAIEAVVDDMVLQIRDLLDATRLQMGRPLDLRRAPTDLVTFARQVVASWEDASERHAVRFESDVAALELDFDAGRMRTVLNNLLSNAIKYSPEGGDVVLGLRLARESDGACAELSVQDQGVGIPQSDLVRVFERFYRVPSAAGLAEGTGIGLAAARQIVAQHGGTISVESREGNGSRFSVCLPLATAEG